MSYVLKEPEFGNPTVESTLITVWSKDADLVTFVLGCIENVPKILPSRLISLL